MARAIMVSEEIYGELTRLKQAGESYSKLIQRFIQPKKQRKKLEDFAGAWNGLVSDKEAEEMVATIRKMRHINRKRIEW